MEAMEYYRIEIETTRAGIEIICAKLSTIGVNTTEVMDPADVTEIMEGKADFEWDYMDDSVSAMADDAPKVTVYTESETEAVKVRQAVKELTELADQGAFGDRGIFGDPVITVTKEKNEDWLKKWKEGFKPFHVTKDMVVKPSWEDHTAENGEKIIEIDPGMAFGTGTHETTAMCLELMEDYMAKGDRVLDAGCGSGILSIGAALLGAKEVLGIDIDEDAVEVARKNIRKNGCQDICKVKKDDIARLTGFDADLCVANLMAELICMTAPKVYDCLTAKGIFISSGILIEKKKMVICALEDAGLEVVETRSKGEWCAICCRKKA